MVRALVCGGGNGAHVLAGLGASHPDTEVRVLTLFADEAERWTQAMEGHDFSIICHSPGVDPATVTGKPAIVSKRKMLSNEKTVSTFRIRYELSSVSV